MKDAGGLDRGGGSRSRKKWLQPLCTPRVKPADRWIGVGCTRRKKARNDSEGSGPGTRGTMMLLMEVWATAGGRRNPELTLDVFRCSLDVQVKT